MIEPLKNQGIEGAKPSLKPEDFWAKTLPDGRPGICVRDHCLNVGCVAEALIAALPPSVRALLPPGAATLAAQHDIGKITISFLAICPSWLAREGVPMASPGEIALSLSNDSVLISSESENVVQVGALSGSAAIPQSDGSGRPYGLQWLLWPASPADRPGGSPHQFLHPKRVPFDRQSTWQASKTPFAEASQLSLVSLARRSWSQDRPWQRNAQT
jgi:hypothetical protein